MSAAHVLSGPPGRKHIELPDPEREDTGSHRGLRELRKFGPLSSSFLNSIWPNSIVAAIVPFGESLGLRDCSTSLNQPQKRSERANYLITIRFSSCFGFGSWL